MSARILDGKAIAAAIRGEVAAEVAAFRSGGPGGVSDSRSAPRLVIVLVGDDPASVVYTRNKAKASAECGMRADLITLPAGAPQEEIVATVRRLGADPDTHGILVQLPLPRGIDAGAVIEAIDPRKDVDGVHPYSAGRLAAGRPTFLPCTPAGILEMLRRSGIEIAGREAVVVGRSEIVGKPVAQLLLAANATVTIAHSKTAGLPSVARRADILVAAIGRPGALGAEHIRPGAVVVDVGINRITDESQVREFFPGDEARLDEFRRRGTTLVGDVHPARAMELASAFSPVPGGVGPLTIAMLMRNTLGAARRLDPAGAPRGEGVR